MARKKSGFSPVVASANDLRTGRVVFRAEDGRWMADILSAQVADDEDTALRLLDAANADQAACRVLDVALVDLEDAHGARTPRSLRDRIRARGPTAGLPALED